MFLVDFIFLVLFCKFNRNSRIGLFFICIVRFCYFILDSVVVCFFFVWESRFWKREVILLLNICNSKEIKWEFRKLFVWLYECIIIVKMLDWLLFVMDCEIIRGYLYLDEMLVDFFRFFFWVVLVY